MGSIIEEEPTDSRKVVLITGGNSGIGAELARRLHRKGYRVAITARRVVESEDLVRDLDPSGETAMFAQCDVASYEQQAAAFSAVWSRWGRLDVFVANAGGLDRDSKYNFDRREVPVDNLPPVPDTMCIDINLKGAMYGTVLAVHFMRQNKPAKGGRIVVVTSMLAQQVGVMLPEYAASKAGAQHWARSIAPVLQVKENVTVNVVSPGACNTDIKPGFLEAFRPEHLCTKRAMMAAFDEFLDEDKGDRTGMVVEVAHDSLHFHDLPPTKAGELSKRNPQPYEPWFQGIHGEPSGLSWGISSSHLEGGDGENVKIIAVTGATGSQGGGVVNIMKNTPGWRIRAITRNPESEKAKQLAADGIEVVYGDFENIDSMMKAFAGAHAAFAVTDWWEPVFTSGVGRHEAGVIEERQGWNLALAASRNLSTLEHYFWSTTPSSKMVDCVEHPVDTPHMDYKANVDARIKKDLPDLAARTTYLLFGYYPQNLATFPPIRPVLHPLLGKYIQTLPTRPDAIVLLSGSMAVNPGIWVRQALAAGSRAFGKYANVAVEKWTFKQMIDEWSAVTGKDGVFVQCSPEAYEAMWGTPGKELAEQFKFGELCDPWMPTADFISPKELGIDEAEVVGFKGTIEGLHKMGAWD
ncbi:hypothetical protein PspLS_06547 [Pyricularia sp. CBS 133598]|nr:hypothetical protein PspLS_06547 [Pyricularia sp. CBS 133598]